MTDPEVGRVGFNDGGPVEQSRTLPVREGTPDRATRRYRHGDFRPTAGAAKAFERICRKHLPASLTRFAAEVAERDAGGETTARAA